jgi:small subunit ribosomal protein S13
MPGWQNPVTRAPGNRSRKRMTRKGLLGSKAILIAEYPNPGVVLKMATTNVPNVPEKKAKETEDIIRMSGRDINGNYRIISALMQIKGIGYGMAHALSIAIEKNLGIPPSTKIGTLSEDQLEKVEEVMKNPGKNGVPQYMLNRRKDFETGSDIHVIGTDLIVSTKQDIDRDIKLLTYRGFRHMYGQKARGQRTRSTGRTGTTVGVTKAKVAEAAKPAPKGAPGAPGAKAAPGAAAPAAGAPAAGGAAPAAAPAPAAGAKPAAKPAEKPAK